jgi:hypothetical protein
MQLRVRGIRVGVEESQGAPISANISQLPGRPQGYAPTIHDQQFVRYGRGILSGGQVTPCAYPGVGQPVLGISDRSLLLVHQRPEVCNWKFPAGKEVRNGKRLSILEDGDRNNDFFVLGIFPQ